jgi:hypothetical protein
MEDRKIEKFTLPKLNETEINTNADEIKENYTKTLEDQTKTTESPVEVNNVLIEEELKRITAEIATIKDVIVTEGKTIRTSVDNFSLSEITEKLDSISNLTSNLTAEFKKQSDLLLSEEINDNLLKLIEYGNHLDEKIDKIQDKNVILVKKILKKVLNKEINENSEKIVNNTFDIIYNEIKASSKIDIYVSVKDFEYIKGKYQENDIINVKSDNNIKAGHCLIISDNMNYDSNLDKKLDLILESIF